MKIRTLDIALAEIERGWFLKRKLVANKIYSITVWIWWTTVEVCLKRAEGSEGVLTITYRQGKIDERTIESDVGFAAVKARLLPAMEAKW